MGFQHSDDGSVQPWRMQALTTAGTIADLLVPTTNTNGVIVVTGCDFTLISAIANTFQTGAAIVGTCNFFSDFQSFAEGSGYTSWRGYLPLRNGDELELKANSTINGTLSVVAWGLFIPGAGQFYFP